MLAGARRAGPGALARVLGGATIWAAIILGLTGVYAYRFEASEIADRVMAELFSDEPQIGQSGEVIVNRRLGGEFVVPAKVNGARVAFLFDTGASVVVLRAAGRQAQSASTPPGSITTSASSPPTAPRWRRKRASTDRDRTDRHAQRARAGRPARRAQREPARHELPREAAELHGRARTADPEGQ